MTNYERIVEEMSHTRMAELLEKSDFCCGAHVSKGDFECAAPEDASCAQCISSWLKKESGELNA
ncbi:MAG: hypothetical protein VB018_03810 [Lachnospiraceae bacterium]|nr:hypothetical protein [Lachnospiraceae bacterium]